MNVELWAPLATSIIISLIGAISGGIALFKGVRKERAEVAARIVEAADTMVEQYRTRLEECERLVKELNAKSAAQEVRLQAQARQIARLQREQEVLKAGAQALCDQIRELGHEPVWEPNGEET